MKIFFVINSLNNRSGSERVACILANSLAENNGYEIKILNRDSQRKDVPYELKSTVNVEKIHGNSLEFYWQLRKIILINKPDVVIVHNMGKLSLLCSFLPKNIKLVILEHVSFISRPKTIQFLSKIFYKRINQVITLTKNDKTLFDKFHSNVHVIPNFSPFPISTNKQNDSKEIVTIGRLTNQKNYIHLLKAWEKVHKLIPAWKLNIYGEGEHQQLLQDYIEQYALKNVVLKGVTSDVKQVYEHSSFFVMSSKYEGLPMVLIEAQSFGLPIISYDCPYGPSDVIRHHQNGLLVEDQDIEKLSEAIFTLATSPELLNQFSRNSLVNAKNYQPEQILKVWVEKVLQG